MNHDDLDRFISSRLEKDELEVPPALRKRIAALAAPPGLSAWKRVKIWAPWLAAAALLLVVSLSLLFPPQLEIKKISQIRTEFSIPGKNIRIIWVQRKDFRLQGVIE